MNVLINQLSWDIFGTHSNPVHEVYAGYDSFHYHENISIPLNLTVLYTWSVF